MEADTMPPRPPARPATPTVFSIGKACGVSGTTVSLALRDDPRLKPETRRMIQDYARKVGYRPNQSARHFKQGRTGSLGLILPSATWWVDSLMLDVFYRHAAQANYDLQVQFTHDDLGREAQAVAQCLEGKVDGLFICCAFENTDELPADYPLEQLRQRRMPCVYLGGPLKDMNRVSRDRPLAAEIATRHLAEMGYEQFHLLLAVRSKETASYQLRADRFLRALKSLGLPADEDSVHYRAAGFERITRDRNQASRLFFDYTLHHRYGYELARDIFASPPGNKRVGLVCASDGLAAGCMRYCREQGLDIPAQVGIVGCDDTIANDLNLTSLRWDHDDLCSQAMAMLTQQINGKPQPARWHQVKPELIQRGSTLKMDHVLQA